MSQRRINELLAEGQNQDDPLRASITKAFKQADMPVAAYDEGAIAAAKNYLTQMGVRYRHMREQLPKGEVTDSLVQQRMNAMSMWMLNKAFQHIRNEHGSSAAKAIKVLNALAETPLPEPYKKSEPRGEGVNDEVVKLPLVDQWMIGAPKFGGSRSLGSGQVKTGRVITGGKTPSTND